MLRFIQRLELLILVGEHRPTSWLVLLSPFFLPYFYLLSFLSVIHVELLLYKLIVRYKSAKIDIPVLFP